MSTNNDHTAGDTGTRHGAPLPPPVIAYAILTICALVVPTLLSGTSMWTSDAAFADAYRDHVDAVRAQAALTMAAAIPLAVLTAIVSDRIRSLGLDVPGRVIAMVGGTVAATLLAVSGLTGFALLGASTTGDAEVLDVGRRLATVLGGTGFAMFSGLLIAGIAITGLMGRILPRSIAVIGIGLAVIAELTVVTILTDSAAPLLPVTRFGGVVWLLAVAATLGRGPADR